MERTKIAHISLVILAITAAWAASAQTGGRTRQGPMPSGGPGGGRMGRPAMPLLDALDSDKNSSLSKAEIANSAKSLAGLDKNKNKKVERDEMFGNMMVGRPMTPPSGAKPPAGAKPGTPPPGGQRGPRPDGDRPGGERRFTFPLVEALDTNKDGWLSSAEVSAAPKNLGKLDKDKNGQISREEMFPPRVRFSPAEMISRMDKNKDGKIAKSEIQGSMAGPMMERFDKNKDGFITKAEIEAGRGQGGSRGR